VTAIKAANLGLRFLIELCALAGVAYWGSRVSDTTAVNVLVAIAAPLALATFWGLLLAPNSNRRLDPPLRTLAELFALAAAVLALIAAGSPILALALAVAALLNGLLLHVWHQDAADLAAESRR
jgi:Protein of unknown function (DUF2568)